MTERFNSISKGPGPEENEQDGDKQFSESERERLLADLPPMEITDPDTLDLLEELGFGVPTEE